MFNISGKLGTTTADFSPSLSLSQSTRDCDNTNYDKKLHYGTKSE